MPNMQKSLTLVKIKHRKLETQLDPCLIYLSRIEKMHVELADEYMDAHCGVGGSYALFKKHDVTLRHKVLKVIHCRRNDQKHKNKI